MNYDKTCFSINGWNDDASNPGGVSIYIFIDKYWFTLIINAIPRMLAKIMRILNFAIKPKKKSEEEWWRLYFLIICRWQLSRCHGDLCLQNVNICWEATSTSSWEGHNILRWAGAVTQHHEEIWFLEPLLAESNTVAATSVSWLPWLGWQRQCDCDNVICLYVWCDIIICIGGQTRCMDLKKNLRRRGSEWTVGSLHI